MNKKQVIALCGDGPSRGVVRHMNKRAKSIRVFDEVYVDSGTTRDGMVVYFHDSPESEVRRGLAEPQFEPGVSKGHR